MVLDFLKEREGLVKNFGIEDVEIGPDRVVMKWLVDVRHVQQGPTDPGTNPGYGRGLAHCPEHKTTFGTEINASPPGPKRGVMLMASGPRFRWRAQIRCERSR
jgi:hypothetical protein